MCKILFPSDSFTIINIKYTDTSFAQPEPNFHRVLGINSRIDNLDSRRRQFYTRHERHSEPETDRPQLRAQSVPRRHYIQFLCDLCATCSRSSTVDSVLFSDSSSHSPAVNLSSLSEPRHPDLTFLARISRLLGLEVGPDVALRLTLNVETF